MCVEEGGQKLETYEVSKDWEIEILFHPNDSAFSSAKEKKSTFYWTDFFIPLEWMGFAKYILIQTESKYYEKFPLQSSAYCFICYNVFYLLHLCNIIV